MGEIADDIVDGLCCELCNSYFEQEHGYPVVCKECWKDLSEENKKKHQKSIRKVLG